MNLKRPNNLLSILFATVVLVLVLFTQNASDMDEEPVFAGKMETTSLAAAAVFLEPPVALSISAPVVLVKELNGRELLNANPDQRWPLASVTKLMAAVVTLENIGRSQKIIMSQEAVLSDGDAGNFRVGEVLTAEDLIKAMMVVSSNDAAVALAEFFGQENFINAMNAKSKKLLMDSTTFFDPAGLNIANQSTVHDIEKLLRYILSQHPDLLTWSRKKEVDISGRRLLNINKFAGQQDFLGGKTGYLEEANGNLVSLFQSKKGPVLIIVLGAGDRFQETQIIYEWYKDNN